ncbi:MAG: peptidylprolyl isomerase [Thermoguttaceae bacterium]|jgi:cyclophilin family peptidyl-prolyl cis-trans isomerase/Flp pilus assembly protein TadD|nr:peptidylprolyl isomerase [Thermoguttaceae bacterium]
MLLRRAMISLMLAAFLVVPTRADEPPAGQPATAEAVPEGSADQAADPGEQFQAVMADWRALLARLQDLQKEFATADDERKAAIRTEFAAAVEEGEEMESKLIRAAEQALDATDKSREEAAQLLVGVLRTEVDADNYEEALRLGELLCEKTDDRRVVNLTGIAAFAAGDFDTAEKRLNQAAEQRTLSERARAFLSDVPEYKRAWAREQKIRAAEAESDDLPRVSLKTNKGTIEIELFENEAPMAVANFVSLIEKGFYDGLTFHRVLPGFMAQGGCPDGTGTGGPGYNIPCECHKPDHRRHFRGTLSMAHAGRDTGGSQFFLTFLPTSHLDGRHTAFGRVISGMDVLAKLQRRDPGAANPPEPDRILEAKVLRKRDHAYEPTKVK